MEYSNRSNVNIAMMVLMVCLIGCAIFPMMGEGQYTDQSDRSEDEFVFIIMCGVIIGSIVISVLIGIWVYRDANSRGMEGVLWLIVVLVGSLVGLIIYLIVRRDHPKGGVQCGYYPSQPYPKASYPPASYPQAPYPPGPYHKHYPPAGYPPAHYPPTNYHHGAAAPPPSPPQPQFQYQSQQQKSNKIKDVNEQDNEE